MIKEYVQYLRDNPEYFWFERKSYGWGWVPVRWQGWLVIVLHIFFITLLAITVNEKSSLSFELRNSN